MLYHVYNYCGDTMNHIDIIQTFIGMGKHRILEVVARSDIGWLFDISYFGDVTVTNIIYSLKIHHVQWLYFEFVVPWLLIFAVTC